MAKPWDDIMKRLFFANPQHFISWLMPGAILLSERNVVLKSRTLETDTLYNVRMNGIAMILHGNVGRVAAIVFACSVITYCAVVTLWAMRSAADLATAGRR